METTIQPIYGISLGIEFTEDEKNDFNIGYCLIDLLFVRIQIAWYV